MLPGKRYTPEDVLQILRRRVWWLLVPLALVSAVTAVVAQRLPDLYRAETQILVVPQRIPESYVRSTVTARLEDRLTAIHPLILNRTRLEQIIQDLDLYRSERDSGMLMEDVVARMRREIEVDILRGDAFEIGYTGRDPRTVRDVTERLASLFIEENLRDRENLAEGTTQFLEAQLDDARRQLIAHEQKLEAYRRQHMGELPSQLEANLQRAQSASAQSQSLGESINRDRDRRLALEQQLTAVEALPIDPTAGLAASGATAQRLAEARALVAQLEMRMKDGHPDLERARRDVRDLEAKVAQEIAAAEAAPGPRPALTERSQRIADLRSQIADLDRQIADKTEEQARLRTVAEDFQRRVEMVPTRESELTQLMRDYGVLSNQYQNLLAKKQDAGISANLESRQISEQFRVLDPARLPERPYSPDRQRINLLGLAAGLGLGLALVGLLEYRDQTFKTDQDIADVLKLPVVASVPLMQSDEDRRAARRHKLMLGLGLGSTVAVCLAVLVYTLMTGR